MKETKEERLTAFEEMLVFVQSEYEKTAGRMETLKAEGREKSATYRQLMGNKLTYQNMLSMYRLYDLI
ncbi:hypothetical protein AALA24_05140 [Anaerovoracaceae bacterium 42-11]|nr:hypothetical protein [Emergencia sp.]